MFPKKWLNPVSTAHLKMNVFLFLGCSAVLLGLIVFTDVLNASDFARVFVTYIGVPAAVLAAMIGLESYWHCYKRESAGRSAEEKAVLKKLGIRMFVGGLISAALGGVLALVFPGKIALLLLCGGIVFQPLGVFLVWDNGKQTARPAKSGR